MKKITAFLLCTLMIISQSMAGIDLPVSAKSAAMLDTLTGQFVFEKNADLMMPMASTTKIMTALIAVEMLDLASEYTVLPKWTGAEGSSMYLKSGEKVTARDLLHGLMLTSGNDAAQAIACIISGSEAKFVELMNARAIKMGLASTNFESASGLDGAQHYTTARELAIIADTAMQNEEFRQIVGQKNYRGANRSMKNHNKLLFSINGALGVKTGFTKKSGRCLVSAVERGGRMMIAVTLNAPDDWSDHENLYSKAFAGCEARELLQSRTVQCEVVGANTASTQIYINKPCTLNLTEQEAKDIIIVQYAPRFVYAPVISGEKHGTIEIMLYGKTIFETGMYYINDIDMVAEPEHGFMRFWNKIKALF